MQNKEIADPIPLCEKHRSMEFFAGFAVFSKQCFSIVEHFPQNKILEISAFFAS